MLALTARGRRLLRAGRAEPVSRHRARASRRAAEPETAVRRLLRLRGSSASKPMPPGSGARISMTPSASIAEPAARVGVVGPGLMGLGIAQALRRRRLRGRCCAGRERGGERARTARGRARRQVARGRMERRAARRFVANVRRRDDDDGVSRTAAIVIESVAEDRALKVAMLAADRAAPRRARSLPTNTSGLAISRPRARRCATRARSSACISFRRPSACRWSSGSRASDRAGDVDGRARFRAGARQAPGAGARRARLFRHRASSPPISTKAWRWWPRASRREAIDDAAIANGRALGPLAMLDETGLRSISRSRARRVRTGWSRASAGRSPSLCWRVWSRPGAAGRRAGGGFFDWPAKGRERHGRAWRRFSRRASPTARPRAAGCACSRPRRARRCAASRRACRERRRRRCGLGARPRVPQAARRHSCAWARISASLAFVARFVDSAAAKRREVRRLVVAARRSLRAARD